MRQNKWNHGVHGDREPPLSLIASWFQDEGKELPRSGSGGGRIHTLTQPQACGQGKMLLSLTGWVRTKQEDRAASSDLDTVNDSWFILIHLPHPSRWAREGRTGILGIDSRCLQQILGREAVPSVLLAHEDARVLESSVSK
jgi:hypothetical protein